MSNIVCLIPARSRSKGIPYKNIINLNGKPLIAYTIETALKSFYIHDTYVSTDSIEIAKIAQSYGAKVPFLRPSTFARDNSHPIEFTAHFLGWFRKEYKYVPEYIVLLLPTTPIREISIVDKAIMQIILNPDCTGLRSVEEFPESPYKWFRNYQNYLYPLIGEDFEVTNLPRQVLPKVYRPNGYVDVLKTITILTYGEMYGKKILPFITPSVVEIDTLEDLEYAKYLLTKNEPKTNT